MADCSIPNTVGKYGKNAPPLAAAAAAEMADTIVAWVWVGIFGAMQKEKVVSLACVSGRGSGNTTKTGHREIREKSYRYMLKIEL